MCVLLLTLAFLALGSNSGCEAFFFDHLFGRVHRGPCQARDPMGPGFLYGTCMPKTACLQRLRGISLNAPAVCGYELSSTIVCCPNVGQQVPHQPFPPYGGGGYGYPIQTPIYYPASSGMNIPGQSYMNYWHFPPQGHYYGQLPGQQVPHQPFPPYGGGGYGYPIKPESYPPEPALPQRPATPSKPTTPSRPVVPPGPTVKVMPPGKPETRPVQDGGSNPTAEWTDDGVPCDQLECEPGEDDSYIHLINPRKGKN